MNKAENTKITWWLRFCFLLAKCFTHFTYWQIGELTVQQSQCFKSGVCVYIFFVFVRFQFVLVCALEEESDWIKCRSVCLDEIMHVPTFYLWRFYCRIAKSRLNIHETKRERIKTCFRGIFIQVERISKGIVLYVSNVALRLAILAKVNETKST